MPIRTAHTLTILLLATLTTVGAGSAMAQQRSNQGQARSDERQRQQAAPRPPSRRHADSRALSAAVRRVERRTGGQVLSAERVPYEGRSLSRIKVVDATGRVRIYMDDPRAARSADQARNQAQAQRQPPQRTRQRTRGDDN